MTLHLQFFKPQIHIYIEYIISLFDIFQKDLKPNVPQEHLKFHPLQTYSLTHFSQWQTHSPNCLT